MDDELNVWTFNRQTTVFEHGGLAAALCAAADYILANGQVGVMHVIAEQDIEQLRWSVTVYEAVTVESE